MKWEQFMNTIDLTNDPDVQAAEAAVKDAAAEFTAATEQMAATPGTAANHKTYKRYLAAKQARNGIVGIKKAANKDGKTPIEAACDLMDTRRTADSVRATMLMLFAIYEKLDGPKGK